MEEEKLEKALEILMKKEGYIWCDLGHSCTGWIKDLDHMEKVHNIT